ncbi:MAG: YggS family pyridoxal phosphate-dependent enzyme [Oscillospiraceae bacterium]|jgi:pyridoxal phosphate enzyme (YggS family)|nr:YggS family pyridoxal phosphate-dependent enzyme [Oscillospiraceae bacterium]
MERLLKNKKFDDIDENLKFIEEKIAYCAQKSGRKYEDIKLMAVTKTVDPVFVNHAIEKGVKLIGENKVQELLLKKDSLMESEVHLIGHLQTNKVRSVINHVNMIQSVDSVKIAQEISRQAVKYNLSMDVLVEVNIGREESKHGFFYDETLEAIDQIRAMNAIKVKGLMAIPPANCDEIKNRHYLSGMYKLFIDIKSKKLDNVSIDILSMGMSDDFHTAILEGSNLVRIGSALFGARNYN